jgi:cytochrome c551/c552
MSRSSDAHRRRPRVGRAARGAIAATCVVLAGLALAAPLQFGFGKPAAKEEIAGWDIDVRPDATGLPRGRGSVEQGQAIYDEKCASCHGTFGESNSYLQIAGGVGTLASDQPVRTTGSKLAHATTLWDYIRRAMPFTASQSLSVDETYALTAYVLNLNDILPADATLDRASLLALKLPNRDGFTLAHGLSTVNGKPDTRNVACMRDCATEVKLASQLPEHALADHGDVSEQTRMATADAAKGTAKSAPRDGAALAKQSSCVVCHAVSAKVVGPSFRDIAAKYAGDNAAEARLAAKVRAGGVGAWGAVPMPAQPQVSETDARALVRWILAGAQ